MTENKELSLQERYAAKSICFGCGPANKNGLRINSFPKGDKLICDWKPAPYHEAFPGCINGGIIGAILDCHSNWTAAWHFMKKNAWKHPECTVTADYSIFLKKPTPSNTVLHLEAKIVKEEGSKAWVDAELFSEEKLCAHSKGCFVLVKPGHIAYHRW